MKRTRITDKITYVEPDSMAGFSSCAGIAVRSRQTVLIDMNVGAKDVPGLLETEKPDAAVITHYHLDHSTWTRYVDAHSDAVILIPEKETPYLTSLDFVIDRTSGPFGMSKEWKAFVVKYLGYKPLTSFECYSGKTTFREMAPEIVVVETPGHSPSHTSFYFPDDNILFSGDMGLDRFGPWYGWADCDILKIVDSILRLDGMAIELILTSHGGILKNEIQAVWAASLRKIIEREAMIARKMDAGIDKQEIIRQGVFYQDKEKAKEPMQSFLTMWDTAMYHHHEALIHDGGVVNFFPQLTGMIRP